MAYFFPNGITINTIDNLASMDNVVVVENSDGSVSAYLDNNGINTPVVLSISSCLGLNPTYTFNIDTQTCYWSTGGTCDMSGGFKLTLNPSGNDGSIFFVEDNNTCSLNIDFNYLFKFQCETLASILSPTAPSTSEAANLITLINNLEQAIANQAIICENLSNQIDIVMSSITNTPYSIYCNFMTLGQFGGNQNSGTNGVMNNNNSGFAPFGYGTLLTQGEQQYQTYVLFCLTDAGLQAWENILGSVAYNSFLNGVSSYNCTQVGQLTSLNQTILTYNAANPNNQQPILGYNCNVEFGTKNNLINQMNALIVEQTACQNMLNSFNAELITLNNELAALTIDYCTTPVQVLETLNVSVSLDIITSANTLETIYETPLFSAIGKGNLYDYLVNNLNSGFYICGGSEISGATTSGCTPLMLNITGVTKPNVYSCNNILNSIVQELYIESKLSGVTNGQTIFNGSLSPYALASNWLNFNINITDPNIINQITDKKVKISFNINNTCANFCVLADNISLNKICDEVTQTNIFLTQSLGFILDKVRDNKKSWVVNNAPENRSFSVTDNSGNNEIRETLYEVDDERLIINTKEIDLNINLAEAIETDVWTYIVNNPCLLTGITGTSACACPCGSILSIDETYCLETNFTNAVLVGTPYTAFAGFVSAAYGSKGANFYSEITNLPFPITADTVNSNIYDATGTIVPVIDNVANSSFWGSGTTTSGRLNTVGIWSTSAQTSMPPFNEWIGFTTCIEVNQTQLYYIGLAADNEIKILLNGTPIIEILGSGNTNNFNYWHVFPITLDAGLNIFEVEGLNFINQATFGFEIYTPTNLSALTASTTTGTTGLIYSTYNLIGDTLTLGTTNGYSCPTGYSLYACEEGIISCIEMLKIPFTGNTEFCCGDAIVDFQNLTTQPLSAVTTIEDFEYYLTSELIDVKSRKTISGYPTLKALYDRYINSKKYCGNNSSAFDYTIMDDFTSLLGDYWVDIIEQVVPATTLWGSVKIYSNTIFDQQKFKYRSYSSLFCANQFVGRVVSGPINGVNGLTSNVDVITTVVPIQSNSAITITTTSSVCGVIALAQYNTNSEFIGSVTIFNTSGGTGNSNSLYSS